MFGKELLICIMRKISHITLSLIAKMHVDTNYEVSSFVRKESSIYCSSTVSVSSFKTIVIYMTISTKIRLHVEITFQDKF